MIQIVAFAREVLASLDHIGIALPGQSKDIEHARDKALAEIALLFTEIRLHSEGDAELHRLSGDAIEHVMSLCKFDRMMAIMYDFPQAALAFGTIALALKAVARESHPLFQMVRVAIESPFFLSTARSGFREQEAHWLAARIRDDAGVPGTVPRTGLLFRRTHPVFLRREDMYAITHESMYLSDFGRRPIAAGAGDTRRACSFDQNLAWALSKADWDLVGELSMAAWYGLDAPTSWQLSCDAALDAVFERFGFVPAPTFDTRYADSLPTDDRERYSRFHAYHTTIVYGLLLLARRPERCAQLRDTPDLADVAMLLSAAATVAADFTFDGSGIDPGWFLAHRSGELRFRNDLVAELVLANVRDAAGIEVAARLASRIDTPDPGSALHDTIEVLVSHRKRFLSFVATPDATAA